MQVVFIWSLVSPLEYSSKIILWPNILGNTSSVFSLQTHNVKEHIIDFETFDKV